MKLWFLQTAFLGTSVLVGQSVILIWWLFVLWDTPQPQNKTPLCLALHKRRIKHNLPSHLPSLFPAGCACVIMRQQKIPNIGGNRCRHWPHLLQWNPPPGANTVIREQLTAVLFDASKFTAPYNSKISPCRRSVQAQLENEGISALHVPAESQKRTRYFHTTNKKLRTHQDTAALLVH